MHVFYLNSAYLSLVVVNCCASCSFFYLPEGKFVSPLSLLA